MKDNKEQILLLLQIAKTNGNVMTLVRNGMELSKLSRLISTLSKHGILCVGNDFVELTSKGEDYLKQIAKSLGKKGLYAYLGVEVGYRNSIKISTEDIYIPTKRMKRKRQ
jgi:predicted transcriptional regulator